jgi:1,4-alpha-glucan branching enzyme
MISRSYYNNGRTCRLTFRYIPERPVSSVYLVSDFDDWDTTARPLVRRKDGSYSTSLVVPGGSRIQFRYLIDNEHWLNDDDADEFVNNNHGETDGVLNL